MLPEANKVLQLFWKQTGKNVEKISIDMVDLPSARVVLNSNITTKTEVR